jgi:hypothetical protein
MQRTETRAAAVWLEYITCIRTAGLKRLQEMMSISFTMSIWLKRAYPLIILAASCESDQYRDDNSI